MAMLTHALPSVEAYADFFMRQPLPILRRTTGEFARMRKDIDNVTRKDLAAIVLGDPLMTMRLLSHIETHRKSAQNHDIVTIPGALIMMGIEPFFAAFGKLPTAEDTLATHPQALLGLLKVIGRACKAARYAHDWAVVQHDLDVSEITIAALLHEAAEMVCWLNAPALTLRVYEMQRADRALRSATAQRMVFGVTARDLQLALIHAWCLPDILVKMLEESQADNPRVRTIALAADFARHVSLGWNNAALPDDIACLCALLRIPPEAVLRRIDAPEGIWPKLLPAAYAGAFPAPPG
ncbi:MAG: HDOD domain-containing protein [Azoarcus sp.]|jgi:HD-like signal output (HDOD) protein|nr:HDOD domain-containing protein [Azoarcus sp.]